jgi:RNA polymerase sigma-70 factor (ECF subfamily)
VDRIYRAHQRWLHAWLERRLGNSHEAADLAHDTFMRLLAPSCSPVSLREPRAFLTTVARGLLANHWRRQDIERAYLEALAAQQADLSAPSAQMQAEVIEALLQVDAMLRGLPAKAMSAFIMVQIEGHTYLEAAAALGVSDRMVRKYMAQAMLHCVIHGGGPP